jgi:hypothetical protein
MTDIDPLPVTDGRGAAFVKRRRPDAKQISNISKIRMEQ